MPESGTSLRGRTEFLYVVNESFETNRSGVVVIKAGRLRLARVILTNRISGGDGGELTLRWTAQMSPRLPKPDR